MIKTLREDYREVLGGEHSLPLGIYLAFVPSTMVSTVLANWDRVEDGYFFEVILATSISVLATFAIYLIFAFTVYRNRSIKPVALPWVLLFALLSGFARGFFTHYSLYLLGLHESLQKALFPAVISTSILGLIIVPGIAVLNTFYERFKAERSHLLMEILNQRLTDQGSSSQPSPDAIKRLDRFITTAQKTLINSDHSETAVVANQLKELNFDVLRPASHAIWKEENKKLNNYSFRDLNKFVLHEYLFTSKYLGLIYGFGIVGFSISHLGLTSGLLYSVIASVILTVVFRLGGKVRTQSTTGDLVRMFTAFTVTGILQSWTLALMHDDGLGSHLIAGVLMNALWISTVGYLVGISIAAMKNHEEISQKLSKYLAKDESSLAATDALAKFANRDFANFLHGEVQNRLMQTALEFEDEQLNPHQLEAKLNSLKNYIAEIQNEYQERTTHSMVKALRDICSDWAGIVDVRVKITPSAARAIEALSLGRANSLLTAVNEAIANSSRHGFANQANLRIAAQGKRLTIELSDNGTGPKAKIKRGLGSRLFDELTLGNWDIRPAESGGAQIVLTLAIS